MAFAEAELAPNSARWDEDKHFPTDVLRKAAELGFAGIYIGEDVGGSALTRLDASIVFEALSYGDVSVAAYLTIHNMASWMIDRFGSQELRRKYLPRLTTMELIASYCLTEPGSGSDAAALRTTATLDGDHYVLNGSKVFISNGLLADLVIVAAKTDPNNKHAMGLFLVERGMPGFERGRNLKKLGMKSQDTAELFFNDVKVPKENLLGDAKGGFYYLMNMLAQERLTNACGAVAGAEAALQATLDYVKERKAFDRPIAHFQNTRFKLAEMRTQVDVAQVFTDRCVMDHNQKKLSPEVAAEAKLFTTELLGKVVDEGVQLHGGWGYMWEYPICRMYANARIQRIFAGTSEIMKEIISRGMKL